MPADTDIAQIIQTSAALYDLYDRSSRTQSWFEQINKSPDPKDKPDQHTDQGIMLGEKYPPFDMGAAINFKNQNTHHSTCIETKARATVGVGFKSSKKPAPPPAPSPDGTPAPPPEPEEDDTFVADELDPLCDTTFQDVMNSIVEDFWQVGNGYMEVVRNDADKIVGLHYVPAPTVRVIVQDATNNIHYLVQGELGVGAKLLARFGERREFLARLGHTSDSQKGSDRAEMFSFYSGGYGTPSLRSEIIHFKRCTSMSRWYGFPDWLSAIPQIELVQMMIQEKFDFFLNRGVPEFMLFLLGKKIDPGTWAQIQSSMQATIGRGNQHKTMAVNINDAELKVQVEKLAMEGSKNAGDFSQMAETLALDIVSAHRTPPVLAGIQISGKMGSTNELPNALLSYQVLVIGPEQHTISSLLGATLGNQKRNGGLKTRAKHFKFKKITEEIPLGMGQQQPGATPTGSGAGANMAAMDTMARRRTPMASGGGGPLADGVKKEDDE